MCFTPSRFRLSIIISAPEIFIDGLLLQILTIVTKHRTKWNTLIIPLTIYPLPGICKDSYRDFREVFGRLCILPKSSPPRFLLNSPFSHNVRDTLWLSLASEVSTGQASFLSPRQE